MVSSTKIRKELEKCNEHLAAWQEKSDRLTEQLKKVEALEIVKMVKAVNMTPAELEPFLSAYANGTLKVPVVKKEEEGSVL